MYNIREIVDNNTLEYDCLDYYGYYETKLANEDLYDAINEIISFCIRPVNPSDDPIDTFVHPLARRLSFEDVSLMGITVEQLRSWSIPKATIEDYQRYLMNLKTVSLNDYFYHCTFPQFGFRCQYSFGSRYKQGMSFNDIVDATYQKHSCRPGGGTFSCGDGQCVMRYKHCHSGRHQLLIESLMKENDLDKECWITMICLTKLIEQIHGISCYIWLMDDFTNEYLSKCPSFFQFPSNTIYSNHVRFFYENIHLRNNLTLNFTPNYICYNVELCEFHSNSLTRDDLICLKKFNKHIQWDNTVENPWSELIWWIEQDFRSCLISTSFISNQMIYFNSSTLYQCSKSLKIISFHRFKDKMKDCIEADDENSSLNCLLNDRYRIRCGGANECWSPIQKENACRSSREQSQEILPFQSFCDGIPQHFYYNLNRQLRYDEDECDIDKLCNNMYSRCDGHWACRDGRDEWNCSQTICPIRSHICISPVNYTIFCLPYTRVNDRNDDCLGATDESKQCHMTFNSYDNLIRFRCLKDERCLRSSALCNEKVDCPILKDDEQFCKKYPLFTCQKNISNQRNEIEQILCELNENNQHRIKYFSIITSSPYPSFKQNEFLEINKEKDESIIIKKKIIFSKEDQQWSHYCNHGIMIEKQLNNKILYKCLCPSNYYGHLCQYVNERISLSLKLSSTNRYEIYDIIILLIDDNKNEIITFHQFQYITKDSCTIKFNRIFLYSIRPKNNSSKYFIRIDIIEKNSMIYIGHWYYSIPFVFLPVNRLSIVLNLSSTIIQTQTIRKCQRKCLNKEQECIEYINNKDKSFCRWKTSSMISHQCLTNSIFIGFKQNSNQSICVLSLIKSLCLTNPCQNHGQCIENNENSFERNYTCICIDERYYGKNCQYKKWQLDVSFDNNIYIPKNYLIAYFYTISNSSQPQKTILLRKLTLFQQIISFYISIPYHLVFIQINSNKYYLIYLQYSSSMYILTKMTLKQQCHSINQYVNSTILKLHFYERIIYFHRLCLNNWNLICFIDQMYLCLCTKDHHANCLPFNQQIYSSENHFQCLVNDQYCLNDGKCYQDHPYCPSTKICLCSNCFFGQQCQFYAKGIGSTLDEILGYEFIEKKPFFFQPFRIQLSSGITIFLFLIGIINGILSLMTFTQKKVRQVGCGLYLLSSSISSLLTVTFFTIKYLLLYLSYQDILNREIILIINCRCIEILLKLCLFIDNWLNACVAIERTYSAKQGLLFNGKQSKRIAKSVILCIIIINTALLVPHMIFLHVFEDKIEGRSWCVIHYKTWIKLYTMMMIFIHYFIPLIIQISSTITIIILTARQRSTVQTEKSFWNHLKRKILKYKQQIISPILIILITLPHLIVTIILDCNKSSRLFWFFLISYFLSFIPAAFIFIIFVIPSPLYRKQFQQCILHLRRRIKRY
ncbi:hypothetical protein I4U23_011065 [Adineta vaga]|nr:hypothetical protein I4U23_011065 [Adineta vaga]